LGEYKFSIKAAQLLINYSTNRNPTPNDKPAAVRPVEGNMVNYVKIEADRLVPGVNLRRHSIQFWDEFFAKHPEVSGEKL
jgi:hypothetical protein